MTENNEMRDYFCPDLSAAEILRMEYREIKEQLQEMLNSEPDRLWPSAVAIADEIMDDAFNELWEQS
jgi:hypothetical protein